MHFSISTFPIADATYFSGFYYRFDNRVRYAKTGSTLTFWFGVSWPVPLANANPATISSQSGCWFYGVIDTAGIRVFTDPYANFPIYYTKDSNRLLITTDLLLFSSQKFKLNKHWVLSALNRNLFNLRYLPEVEFNVVNPLLSFRNEDSPVTGVNRMPHGAELHANSSGVKVKQYYFREQDYKHAAGERWTSSEVDQFFSERIVANTRAICEQVPNLGMLSSTGVDSLSIVESLLHLNKSFRLASYGFTKDPLLQKWSNNARGLHQYLNSVGITSFFDTINQDAMFDRLLPDTWRMPSDLDDMCHETYVATKYLGEVDGLIKGSNGDECFMHTQRLATLFLAQEKLASTFNEAVSICRSHYSFQDDKCWITEESFVKAQSAQQPLIDTWLLKPDTYLSADMVFLNKPIYSPYCDRELQVITAHMSVPDQFDSILNAGPQQRFLNKTKPFLNTYKSGEQQIQNYLFPLTSTAQRCLDSLTEVAKKHHFDQNLRRLLLPYQGKQLGDLVSYNTLKLTQMGAWLENWDRASQNPVD